VAERQGRYLANAFNQREDDPASVIQPFAFTSMGMLAYIGNYEGLSDLPEVKLRGNFD
jgi:NADH:ubiquinone reductase (non-electrogenic)